MRRDGWTDTLVRWMGVELDEVSATEKLVSGVGGFLGILALGVVCERALGGAAPVLVASMGASAVLVFAVPHGQLSQPWPVLAGHIVSAAIGVTCALLLGTSAVVAALAVGLTILAMHQFKFIHPPGGATALTAVIGGPAVTGMGYRFVVAPVAINAVLLVALAVAINAVFPWRRYPALRRHTPRVSAATSERSTGEAADPADARSHDAVLAALREIDSFVDITEDDLLRLHRIISRLELDAELDAALDAEDGPAAEPRDRESR
jgi:CBS-domain-containing membrane protein